MRQLLRSISLFLLASSTSSAGTYVVRPDGTGDYSTIQAALDAVVPGDIIELTDGTFTGDGNRDLDFLGKDITVRSRTGDPASCVLDGGAGPKPIRTGSSISVMASSHSRASCTGC